MKELKNQIPNALTSANLVFGCLAMISALNGELIVAAYFIMSAAVLDFFDGFVARALNAQSEIGKQLDSLADVVSFGVAPGMIFYMFAGQCSTTPGFCITPYVSLLIPVFSALRLAKFNIDTRQSDQFIGLPTPANAMFICSIPFLLQDYGDVLGDYIKHPYFLKSIPMLSAYLLTAELPLIALKFKNFSIADNVFRYLLILLSAISVAVFQFAGLSLVIVLYILLSIIQHTFSTKQTA